MLIFKLPVQVRDHRNRKVFFIRKSKKREPRLYDFIRSVEKESVLVNDPLFSKEGVASFLDSVKCLVCEGTHEWVDCKKIIEKGVAVRSKIVGKNKLCYGCLQRISKELIAMIS